MNELIKKITKIFTTKASLKNISSRVKFIIAIAILFILKLYFRSQNNLPLRQIMNISISEFLEPLNLKVLEKVKVYRNSIIAEDKFSNLIKTKYGGMPSNVLFN